MPEIAPLWLQIDVRKGLVEGCKVREGERGWGPNEWAAMPCSLCVVLVDNTPKTKTTKTTTQFENDGNFGLVIGHRLPVRVEIIHIRRRVEG